MAFLDGWSRGVVAVFLLVPACVGDPLAVATDAPPETGESTSTGEVLDEDENTSGPGEDSTGAPAVCGDGIRNGDEECDGADFGERSCGPNATGELICEADCTVDTCDCEDEPGFGQCGPAVCGNGVQETGEECDGTEFFDHLGAPLSCWDFLPDAYGSLTCTRDCLMDTSSCMGCGDGIFDPRYEECDGPPLGVDGKPLTCREYFDAGYAGQMTCSPSCELRTSECEFLCGNGQLDEGELCDADDLGAHSCAGLGFEGGTLSCHPNDCELRTHECHLCGNGVVDDDEVCDGDDFSAVTCADYVIGGTGALSCTETCEADATTCGDTVGLLVISEVMVVSNEDILVSDGEWIELHNPDPVDAFPLAGCDLIGLAPGEDTSFDASLTIPPGGYLTLGKGTAEQLGFVPDAALPPIQAFTNVGDLVRIECDGLLADEVLYDDVAPWPSQALRVAMVLRPDSLSAEANDAGAAWCAATETYAAGFLGTPGTSGGCP